MSLNSVHISSIITSKLHHNAGYVSLSCILWTYYTDQREQFWSWNIVITQNLKPEKGCVTEKLSSPSSKEMEALSSPKMTMENCLGTINMCMFWISLTIVTLCAECYCSTLSLWWPFFAKGFCFFAIVSSFCMKMPGIIHTTGLTAVYGSTSDRLWISHNLALSVLSFTASLRSTWLASDCNRCWCEAS